MVFGSSAVNSSERFGCCWIIGIPHSALGGFRLAGLGGGALPGLPAFGIALAFTVSLDLRRVRGECARRSAVLSSPGLGPWMCLGP
jgi:hypothetical protein